ncbi:hypothetical protein [Streptococcus oricebi]|uniref:hypothetical protein n=1 Tax=Streptococcus oricebi TaxID=1547447 RepID=UPI001AE122C5|nr:hypothetical protein [Streptococcus oricebi]
MATKSFTTDFVFTRKSADNFISALTNNKRPNLSHIQNTKEITKIEAIKAIFSKE